VYFNYKDSKISYQIDENVEKNHEILKYKIEKYKFQIDEILEIEHKLNSDIEKINMKIAYENQRFVNNHQMLKEIEKLKLKFIQAKTDIYSAQNAFQENKK